MGIELFGVAVFILALFAVFDLIVGVSNDAVNFLNSAIGSKVATRRVILIVASLGILAGVLFSSGMMEVARKGIFHPEFFTMPQLITLFLAVMFTDVILLDFFSSNGLPTSTTVSVVFELLGAAVAVSIISILHQNGNLSLLADYINTSKALLIIFGILLSVIVAFLAGALAQFLSRLLFTFDFAKRLPRYGALWGGIAMAFITYFVLVKGAKGAAFITPEMLAWIKSHTLEIIGGIGLVSAIVLQILMFLKVNILRPIILIGTFSLAMAFAANDLVNFIGVPMAGFHAYKSAIATDNPLTATMEALSQKVPAETGLLLLAGLIMIVTLWFSKKARTVTKTEVDLSRQEEGEERFESVFLARFIVKTFINFMQGIRMIIPRPILNWFAKRMDTSAFENHHHADDKDAPSFDLIRAGVNLMVASAVISYATSHKLPLSTTYVTFMVAMGTSFADLAWGRESAVYRVTGVLTVIGGWFMTAMVAFTVAALFAVFIYYTQAFGIAVLMVIVIWAIYKNHQRHKDLSTTIEEPEIYNLRKIKDVNEALSTTSHQTAVLIRELSASLSKVIDGLIEEDSTVLRAERKKSRQFQTWANIIIANLFKCMRLIQKSEHELSLKYAQTIRRIQKLVDGHRDIAMRSHLHVRNHHKGLLKVQKEEILQAKEMIMEILLAAEETLNRKNIKSYDHLFELDKKLRAFAENLNHKQIERIRSGESKTRLSILFYAIVGNFMMISKQNLKLMEIFHDSFSDVDLYSGFDMD